MNSTQNFVFAHVVNDRRFGRQNAPNISNPSYVYTIPGIVKPMKKEELKAWKQKGLLIMQTKCIPLWNTFSKIFVCQTRLMISCQMKLWIFLKEKKRKKKKRKKNIEAEKDTLFIVDRFHYLSTNNVRDENDDFHKLLNSDNRISFMSAFPIYGLGEKNIDFCYNKKKNWWNSSKMTEIIRKN